MTQTRPRPIVAAALAALLVLTALHGSAPVAAQDPPDPTPIAQGSLTWGFKTSFRTYLASGPAPPVVDLTGGVTADAEGVLTFPVVGGSFDTSTGATEVDLGGSVRWRKYTMAGSSPPPGYDGSLDGHILDMTLAEPHLTISDATQELTFEVMARDQGTWEMVDFGRIAMANLSIVDATPVVTETTTTWTAIPATITETAAEDVMFGQYRPGAIIDPVTVTYDGPGGVPNLTETWDEPGSTRLGPPTIASGGPGVDGVWLDDPARGVVHHRTRTALPGGGFQRGLQAFDLATMAPIGEPLLLPQGSSIPNISLFRSDDGRAYYEGSDPAATPYVQWDPATRRYLTGTDPIPFQSTGRRAMWDPVGHRAISIERRVPTGVDPRAYDLHQWLVHVYTPQQDGAWTTATHALPNGPTGLNQRWYPDNLGGTQASWAVAGDGSVLLTRNVSAQAPATVPETLALQRLVIGPDGAAVSEVPGSERGTASSERFGSLHAGPDGLVVAIRPYHNASGAPTLVQTLRAAADGSGVVVEGTPVSMAPTQVFDAIAVDPVDGTTWGASSATRELVAVRDGRVIGRQHHPALHARSALVVVGPDHAVYAQTMVGEDQFSYEMARFERLGSSPGVATQPTDQTVTLGLGPASTPVAFTAAAEGEPAPTYRWQSAPSGASRFTDVAGASGPTLTVDATVGDDGTRFRAVVTNPAGSTVTDEALLTVLAAPVVTAQPQDGAAVEGDDATFALAATGNPQPAIQWQRDAAGFWVDLPDATDPFLTVEDTNLDMDGTRIRARLRNDVATTYTRTAILTVTERPDGPVTVVGGDLDWGVRESFRRYITGTIAHGEITVSGGATDDDDTFRFPAASGSVLDGSVDATFDGAVRFTGHDGTGTPPGVPALDITIEGIRIAIAGDTGTLVADVASRGLDDGAMATYDDVALARLDLGAVAPMPIEGGLRYAGVPVMLTEDGSAAFADFYAPGEALDPLDITLLLGDAPPPRTGAESFVTAALTDFLGAEPASSDVAAGVAALAASSSRSAYLTTLARSDGWLRAIVDRLYADTLGRPADPDGAAFWVGRLRRGGWSVARVAASFYSSDEYLAGAGGGTVATWVDDLYATLLGRPADAAGRAYWVGEAGRIGRGAVALRFFQSAESAGARVVRLYQDLLGRAPSAGDRDWWGPVVVRRGDLVLAVAVAASPEYHARARLRFP